MKDSLPHNLQQIRDLYEKSLEQHGTSAKAVGWGSEQAHLLRFEKLATLIDTNEPISVSDLGCGYGAFVDFLVARGVKLSRFRGYDISERMLRRAKNAHPEHEWVLGSCLDTVTDYAFACGIFNVRGTESDDTWEGHVKATLDDLNRHSLRGFAFNLLSTYVDFRAPNLYYGDPCRYFDYCRRRYSRRVALLHDYPLFEWTMLVRK